MLLKNSFFSDIKSTVAFRGLVTASLSFVRTKHRQIPWKKEKAILKDSFLNNCY